MDQNGSPEPDFETDSNRSYFPAKLTIHSRLKRGGQAGGQVKGQAAKKSLSDIEKAILRILEKRPSSRGEVLDALGMEKRTGYFRRIIDGLMDEESVFYYLQNTRKDSGVFLKPSRDEVHKYLSNSENPLVVRPLISQSPLITVNEVQTPKLEKIMVDLVADEVLFNAFQGKELKTIYSNIADNYDVNLSTLKRYSQRRNKWAEVMQYLKEIN